MIEFYKISSPEEVINYAVQQLLDRLERGEHVLWLLSGGSAIALEVEIAKRLVKAKNLSNLKVSLIDERFGPVGHPDSNWQQLLLKGFDLPGARLQPVLLGKDMKRTAEDFADFLRAGLAERNYILGLVGIGADGHTLGVKPGSPAIASTGLVEAYDWDDYRRITTTANLIKRLDEVIVYAVGTEKKQQLEKLRQDLPVDLQPAQLLKLAPRVIIFNDSFGRDDY